MFCLTVENFLFINIIKVNFSLPEFIARFNDAIIKRKSIFIVKNTSLSEEILNKLMKHSLIESFYGESIISSISNNEVFDNKTNIVCYPNKTGVFFVKLRYSLGGYPILNGLVLNSTVRVCTSISFKELSNSRFGSYKDYLISTSKGLMFRDEALNFKTGGILLFAIS